MVDINDSLELVEDLTDILGIEGDGLGVEVEYYEFDTTTVLDSVETLYKEKPNKQFKSVVVVEGYFTNTEIGYAFFTGTSPQNIGMTGEESLDLSTFIVSDKVKSEFMPNLSSNDYFKYNRVKYRLYRNPEIMRIGNTGLVWFIRLEESDINVTI